MCVLAFAWRADPRWLLVAAGNRDELHARPSGPLARWDQPGHLLAGRDLQSGGTWLGVSERGRFAVVTNLRDHESPPPGRASRGALVTGALAGESPDLAGLDLAAFNPFNLIVADRDEAHFLSNRPAPVRSLLAPGIYGLSNGALDEPWAKTVRLKALLRDWIASASAPPAALLDGLRDDRLPDESGHRAGSSGVAPEPALSPIFIRHPVYGTRCSTVVAIDADGNGLIVERRYDSAGAPTGESALAFSWPPATPD